MNCGHFGDLGDIYRLPRHAHRKELGHGFHLFPFSEHRLQPRGSYLVLLFGQLLPVAPLPLHGLSAHQPALDFPRWTCYPVVAFFFQLVYGNFEMPKTQLLFQPMSWNRGLDLGDVTFSGWLDCLLRQHGHTCILVLMPTLTKPIVCNMESIIKSLDIQRDVVKGNKREGNKAHSLWRLRKSPDCSFPTFSPLFTSLLVLKRNVINKQDSALSPHPCFPYWDHGFGSWLVTLQNTS